MILNESLYYYRISSGFDSTRYYSIATQVEGCAHLSGLPWLDPETRSLIRKNGRISRHRLFTIALQEKRWNEVLPRAERSAQPCLRDQKTPFLGLETKDRPEDEEAGFVGGRRRS